MKTKLAFSRQCGVVGVDRPCCDVGVGTSLLISELKGSLWQERGFAFGLRNSPGTVNGSPYTSSAAEVPRSSLGTVLRPKSTHGSSSVQRGPCSLALSAALSVRWKRSTKPFDCGWYAVVLWIWIPSWCAISVQRAEVKWGPLSEDMSIGTPKRAIQCPMRALAQSEVDVWANGMASGQRVVRSIMVSRCVNPSEVGSGPTKSMWIWLNLFAGTGICRTCERTWDWIFDAWQAIHSFVHLFTCFLTPCQTNFFATSFTVAFRPGCARLWIVSNTWRWKVRGTIGRGWPNETSQSRTGPDSWIWMGLTVRPVMAVL